MIEGSKEAMAKILESNQIFYDFMNKIQRDYQKAVDAKSQGKHGLVTKIANNIKDKAISYLTDPEKLLSMGKFIYDHIKKLGRL